MPRRRTFKFTSRDAPAEPIVIIVRDTFASGVTVEINDPADLVNEVRFGADAIWDRDWSEAD